MRQQRKLKPTFIFDQLIKPVDDRQSIFMVFGLILQRHNKLFVS